MTLNAEKAISLGHPSYVWRSGQERRLNLIRRHVPLEGATMLDIGCGIGTYVRRLCDFSDRVYGIDIDLERVERGQLLADNLAVAVGECLPFADNTFDLVLLNEVIEHVSDDSATMRETWRVLRPGGHVAVYAPNRLYFFETHGVYVGKRYVFGNIPLVNWLPTPLRNRLVPHARAYTSAGIRKVMRPGPWDYRVRTQVYPGFDNVAVRFPRLGPWVKRTFHFLENTPLRAFGLSHFLLLRKVDPSARGLARSAH